MKTAILFLLILIPLLFYTRCKCTTTHSNSKLLRSVQLWSDHVYWTREVLILFFLKAPAAQLQNSLSRLMQNQEEIGAFLNSSTLTTLLKTHITQAINVVKSLDQPNFNQAVSAWQQNAIEVGTLLNQLTNNKHNFVKMMQSHLQLTTSEVLSLKNNNWSQSIIDFQNVLNEAIHMGKNLV